MLPNALVQHNNYWWNATSTSITALGHHHHNRFFFKQFLHINNGFSSEVKLSTLATALIEWNGQPCNSRKFRASDVKIVWLQSHDLGWGHCMCWPPKLFQHVHNMCVFSLYTRWYEFFCQILPKLVCVLLSRRKTLQVNKLSLSTRWAPHNLYSRCAISKHRKKW